MQYAAWYYDKVYSQDDAGGGNSYADRLRLRADTLVAGILDGTLDIGTDATPLDTNVSAPDFFPNDASSNPSTAYAGLSKSSFGYLGDGVPGVDYDTSDGGPAFSMGSRW
jgi:hypothetical protein